MRSGCRCKTGPVVDPRILARVAHVSTYVYVCVRTRALVLHARLLMIVLQNERGNTRAEAPSGARRGGEEGEERIEEANSTGQAAGSSAGPALGPTGGPGVTFQDGCA